MEGDLFLDYFFPQDRLGRVKKVMGLRCQWYQTLWEGGSVIMLGWRLDFVRTGLGFYIQDCIEWDKLACEILSEEQYGKKKYGNGIMEEADTRSGAAPLDGEVCYEAWSSGFHHFNWNYRGSDFLCQCSQIKIIHHTKIQTTRQ